MRTTHWETFWSDQDNHSYWETPAPEALEFIKSQSPLVRPMVLDLGCGLGRHALEFARRGFSVYASDDSLTAINTLQKKAREANLDIQTKICDFLDDGFPGRNFDIIMSYNVIYHGFREQFAQAIRRAWSKLNPGSIFYFTCPDRDNGKYGFGEEVAAHTFLAEKSVTPGHIHYFSDADDLNEMLADFAEYSTITHRGYWNNKGEEQFYSYWEVFAKK